MPAARPGTVLPPSRWEVSDACQARDVPGQYWYNATIVEKLYVGPNLAVRVRFVGFPESHAKIITAMQKALRIRLSPAALKKEKDEIVYAGRLRGRRPDGTWPIEAVIGRRVHKRKPECRIRWQFWDESYDTWEPAANIPPELIRDRGLRRLAGPPPEPADAADTASPPFHAR